MKQTLFHFASTLICVLALSLVSCADTEKDVIETNGDSNSQQSDTNSTGNPLLVAGNYCFGYEWSKGQTEQYEVYTEEIIAYSQEQVELRKRQEMWEITCVGIVADTIYKLEMQLKQAQSEIVVGSDTLQKSTHPMQNHKVNIAITADGSRVSQNILPRNPVEHPSGPYANLFPPLLHKTCAIGGENWLSEKATTQLDETCFPPTRITSQTLVEFNELAGQDSSVVVLTYHKSGQASEGIIPDLTKERTTAVVSEQGQVAIHDGIILDAEISVDVQVTTVGRQPKEKKWRHLIKSQYRRR